jgi:glycosyltransferase involved in cell wall biosynthesis
MGTVSLPRVLVLHNHYQQAGGEDSVFASEVALLRTAGCDVETLEVSNDNIRNASGQAAAALGVVYNPHGRKIVAAALKRVRPDVLHVHNFFPQISPAVFDACAEAQVPAVWTLHNFRVTCANGLLFRDGHPCEDCVGRAPLPAIAHRCYRGSAIGSAAVAAMIAYHRARGTWQTKVARFIALTEFSRAIAVRAGLPAARIAVKPNFLPDPRQGIGPAKGGRIGAVYVGRLSPEKGVASMTEAWGTLPGIPLTILGDGPDRASLERAAPPNVRFLGFQERDTVLRAVAGARALILPSTCYENFPMTVVEAMALGTPVIASRIGALQSIVSDGRDGLHFAPGDAADLARIVRAAFADPTRLDRLGEAARETWRTTMSPEINLAQLLAIYRDTMAEA